MRIWGSCAEDGTEFSPACQRLATVLHVHFLSKVHPSGKAYLLPLVCELHVSTKAFM